MVAQRHGRVQETQLKCTKARNDYLLNLAAANAAMNKYYLQDVSTLIDVRNTLCLLVSLCVCVGGGDFPRSQSCILLASEFGIFGSC